MTFSAGFGSHEDGHVAVCYSQDGKRIISGGTEGDVKIYSGVNSTEDPEQTFFADAFNVSLIKQWEENLVAASEGWSLQKWGFPEGNKSGFLGKFSGNVTHFSLNFDKDKILVGSAEFIMKITDLASEEQSTIKGHSAPILRTAFGKQFFASSSCDGTLKVWDAKSRECLKTFDIYPKSNDVDLSKVRGAIQFDSYENLIVAKENEVVLYSSGDWSEKKTIKSDDMNSILELELSYCKRYLVIGCKDGTILIWDLHTYSCVNKMKCVSVPSSIATHPSEYKMLVGDLRGKWRECDPYVTSEMISSAPKTEASLKTNTQNGVEKYLDVEAEDFEDWGDDEDQDFTNMDRDEDDIKAVASRNAAIINDDDDDSNEPSILEMAKLPERPTTPEIIKQEPVVAAEPEPVYVGPELQEAFQVSSSPDHLKYRYLVWNEIGTITSREEDDSSYINIEFHDSTTHHPLHMVNSEDYILGSMSKQAYALANSGSETKSKNSKILVNIFSSWSASKEWTVNLPKEESAVLLSVSNTLLCVVSDLNYVRTWSLGGLQRHVISLPGDPVTLSTHNDLISVAHYSGTTLSFSLYDTKKPRLIHTGPLPVTPSSSLSWIGFTEGALPLVFDSEGVLRALLPHANLMWVPLADLRVGKRNLSDTYWVVSATDEAIKCVLCKGVTYPGLSPRPMLSIVPHTVPLCDAGSERTSLEQNRVLNFVKTYSLNKLNTFHKECRAETMEKEEVTLLLKLMALAIKNNKDFKAFELAKMMPTKQSLEMATRYASKTGRVMLAQKINDVLRKYEEVST
ncbi:WD repeat and HMG-box DNA-binding protein 1-like isoform X2 [Bolinopsis microptera]|uniref:WD repeat and HMG-box DNA-binding protein 1-like isoform X2 n=1 Tax=Bolinopsis microptera TaxID=2820187 RepID=UPI003078E575